MKHLYTTLFFIVSLFTAGFAQNEFITTWQTTSSNETITIPTTGSGYNYTVAWGDGTEDTSITGDASHTFTTPGTYTVKIKGDFPRIYINGNFAARDKIISVDQWGTQQWTSMESAFRRCSLLVINATDAPDLSLAKSMKKMFEMTSSLVDHGGNIGNWDVSTIENMEEVFDSSNFNENISTWNVSAVKDFSSMFFRNTSFNQNLDSWNTSAGEVFSYMFQDATAFNGAIGSWNTELARSLSNMFSGATVFNQDISAWDVKNVGNINNAFDGATAFDQDLGSWDISSLVENTNSIQHMFSNSGMSTTNYDNTLIGWARLDAGETKIPVGVSFDAENVSYCLGEAARTVLTSAPYNWIITDGGKICPEDAFITSWLLEDNDDITIRTTSGYNYNYTIDWGDGTVDYNVTTNISHNYTTAGTYEVSITGEFPRFTLFFRFGKTLRTKIQTIEQWGNIQWRSFRDSFNDCENLKLNADDTPDLSQVTELSRMFEGCTNFEDLKDRMGSWDMSTIESIESMFAGCSIFNEDISAWTFTNLLSTDAAFEEAITFNQNISSWNMVTVIDMENMFYNAAAFNQPVGNWTLGMVEDMKSMFAGATNFNQDVSSWDFSQVQDIKDLFSGASSFDQDLSSWDISSVTDMTGIFLNSGLSQENYDNTLIGWAALENGETTIPTNLTLDADVAHCSGVNAVSTLTSSLYNWMINDGGNSCDFTDAFITAWETTTDNESITIPTTGAGYNYAVDWGDGTIEVAITGDATHSYATAGTYQVKITGTFPSIYFNNSGDKDKILAIEQWGTQQWQSMEAAFFGCPQLVLNATDVPDLSLVTSLFQTFQDTTSFIDNGGEISNWDTSTIEFLSRAFKGSAFNENINNWDVSKVKSAIEVFQNATLFNQPLNNWEFTSATLLRNMFNGASSFDQNLGNWDLSNINSTIGISDLLSNSGMSTSNYDATLIGWATLDAGEIEIPTGVRLGATGITYCLGEAARNTLTSAPYNWIITDGGLGCDGTEAFITTWTVADGGQIMIPNFSMFIAHNYNVDWGDGTFSTANTSSTSHTYVSGGTYRVSITGNMPTIFFGTASDTTKESLQTIEQWGNQKWEYLSAGFAGCVNLKLNADDTPDLSEVSSKEISSMFSGCTNFEDLKDNIENWDMSQIEDISFMFFNCAVFNEDISTWSFDNLIDTTYTFSNALSFNQDISNWDMSNLERGIDMFKGASSFNQNLAGWDLSSLINDLEEIFVGTALSQENYDNTLIGWATLEAGETQIPIGNEFSADATYCLGEAARDTLTGTTYNWIINDGGLGCVDPVITLLGDDPQIIEKGDTYTELGAEVTYGATLTINAASVNTNQVGSYTVTYDATNTVSGATATQVTRTVDVVDTTAPVITLNGANPQTIELGAGYSELGANSDDGSVININTSEFIDAVGSYTIYYDATDAAGNVAVQVTRTVSVVDTTNPTVVCQNVTVQLDDTGNASITAAMVDNGSSDLSGIASLVIDVTDFDCATIGDNVVVLTVTDANGNSDMCMATVTIEDRIAPEFDMVTVPTDMEVTFDSGNMYTLADFTDGVVVTDNCDSNRTAFATTITQSPVAGTLLAEGDHLITLTATDDNANEQTTTFTITVTDAILSVGENTEEVFTLYPNPTIDQIWIAGLHGEAQVTLSDINGRVLRTIKIKNDQSVSIADLSEGVYLIKIEQDDVYQTTRLIKN